MVLTTFGLLLAASSRATSRFETWCRSHSKETYPPAGSGLPQTPLHSRIYLTRNDVHATIHAHSPVTLGTALAGVEIKPITPESVLFVGEVPIVEFKAPGTEDLADRVVEALKSHQVAVMQNHGVVATGGNMVEALNRLGVVELTARIMTIANIWGGSPALSPNQLEKLKRPATSS